MKFKQAKEIMINEDKGVKLPSWQGYWTWDKDKETVLMHCKDNKILDIRETQVVNYTLDNICSDEWIISTPENTPILGGEALFSYEVAKNYIKRGIKLQRKEWLKSAYIKQCEDGYVYSFIKGRKIPYSPSFSDVKTEDWRFFD